MSSLETVLEEARKLPLNERRQLAARLLDESSMLDVAQKDARLAAMREAANDELFLADLNTTMEDFKYADQYEQPA
jgi:hypothetical protein